MNSAAVYLLWLSSRCYGMKNPVLKNLISIFFEKNSSTEQRITDMFFFVVIAMSVSTFIMNLMLGFVLILDLPIIFTAALGFIIQIRFRRNNSNVVKIFIFYTSLLFFPYMFFVSGGSQGPILLYLNLFIFMTAIIFTGNFRTVIIGLLLLEYSIVYALPYFLPSITFSFPSEGHQLASHIYTIILSGSIFSGVAVYISRIFSQERDRASELLTRIQEKNRELLEQANRDPLTGIYNRRFMYSNLENEINTHLQKELPMCVLMMDIDHFKKINDTYGHSIGDDVLRVSAKLFQSDLLPHDILARYGGEEFAVILPACTKEDAITVAESLRKLVETAKLGELRFTISIGVAS